MGILRANQFKRAQPARAVHCPRTLDGSVVSPRGLSRRHGLDMMLTSPALRELESKFVLSDLADDATLIPLHTLDKVNEESEYDEAEGA